MSSHSVYSLRGFCHSNTKQTTKITKDTKQAEEVLI